MAADKPAEFVLNQSSPIFAFDEGKTYVAPVALPDAGKRRVLILRSYLNGSWLPDATVFYPNVVFLNEQKQQVRTSGNLALTQHRQWIGPSYYEARILVRPDEAFAVFRAEPLRVGKTVPYEMSGAGTVAPIGGTAVYFPATGRDVRQLPAVAGGRIEVTVNTAP